jgi:hypothetical protein
VLFFARLGATAAYLTSYPLWVLSWLRRRTTLGELRIEAKRWAATLLEAWRT